MSRHRLARRRRALARLEVAASVLVTIAFSVAFGLALAVDFLGWIGGAA